MGRLNARRRAVTPPKGNHRDRGSGERSSYGMSEGDGGRAGGDPQTWVGFFYRITGEPTRALILVSVLLALAGGVAVVAFLAGAASPRATVLSAAGASVLVVAYCVLRK